MDNSLEPTALIFRKASAVLEFTLPQCRNFIQSLLTPVVANVMDCITYYLCYDQMKHFFPDEHGPSAQCRGNDDALVRTYDIATHGAIC